MVATLVNTMNAVNPQADSIEEDARVIAQACNDPSAFAPLYERYYDRIYLFLLRRTGNPDVAEDLTSETFIKAMRGLFRYQFRKTPFLAWLYRIAHNTFVSHCRKETVRSLFRVEKQRAGVSGADTVQPNPSEETEKKMLKETIVQLLQRLKQKDQLLVTLRYFEEMSVREIAQIAGLSEPAASTRLHRALIRLRKIFETEAPDVAMFIKGEA